MAFLFWRMRRGEEVGVGRGSWGWVVISMLGLFMRKVSWKASCLFKDRVGCDGCSLIIIVLFIEGLSTRHGGTVMK